MFSFVYFWMYFFMFVLNLVVSASANNCLERLISKVTYYVT